MEKSDIAHAIKRVISGELDDCERSLKAGNTDKARRELDDAVSKLKRIVHQL